jgi:Pyruvate/2-oxoacid:ferredoxin oxidoreductase delta subunit
MNFLSIQKHKQSHNSDKPYQCKLCTKTFKSTGAVYNHVKRDHEKECSIGCGICGKMFPTKVIILFSTCNYRYFHIYMFDRNAYTVTVKWRTPFTPPQKMFMLVCNAT